MREIWKDIPGFEGCYQASNSGKIKSKKRTVTYSTGKTQIYPSVVLIPGVTESGYYSVTLCKDTRRFTKRVCRLIGLTFIPNPENKPQINHKDGDKKNDAVSNLEWSTGSENQLHRYRVLKKGVPVGEKHANSKVNNSSVKKIRQMHSTGLYSQRAIGDKFGISQPTVWEIVNNKIWTHI